jgi:type I restriction enzyme S subunit
LGDVPEGWEVKRVKYILKSKKGAIKTGPFGSQLQSAEMVKSDIKVYNQRSVIDQNFSSGENYISLAKFSELRAFEVFPGDLLVTTRGTIGRCAILPSSAEKGILHPCLMRLQLNPQCSSRFIEILIQESGRVLEQLQVMSNATTIEVIYSESLKEVWLALPLFPEQTAIASYLDRETDKIDRLVAKIGAAIDRLQEYRTALITAAVTGKIDVRNTHQQEAVA